MIGAVHLCDEVTQCQDLGKQLGVLSAKHKNGLPGRKGDDGLAGVLSVMCRLRRPDVDNNNYL